LVYVIRLTSKSNLYRLQITRICESANILSNKLRNI